MPDSGVNSNKKRARLASERASENNSPLLFARSWNVEKTFYTLFGFKKKVSVDCERAGALMAAVLKEALSIIPELFFLPVDAAPRLWIARANRLSLSLSVWTSERAPTQQQQVNCANNKLLVRSGAWVNDGLRASSAGGVARDKN